MNLDLMTYSPGWYWYYSGAAFIGFVLSVLIASMVVGISSWKATGIFMKTVLVGSALATVPLGFASVGMNMAISHPELISITSIAGVAVSVFIGVPYLLTQLLSGKGVNSKKKLSQDVQGLTGELEFEVPLSNKDDYPSAIRPGVEESKNTIGKLEFRSGPTNGEKVELGSSPITIGRSQDNDVVIDDPSVSRNHARLIANDGRYIVEDLGSTNGTTLNGKSIKKEPVDPGATLNLGSVEIFVDGKAKASVEPKPTGINMPAPLSSNTVVRKGVVNSGFLTIEGKSGAADIYSLQPGNNVVGRDADCDLAVSDPFISRKHALISINNGKALITDLGSRGGLKVNDQPVNSASVVPGTEISIGETKIQLLEIETPGESDVSNKPDVTQVFQHPGKSATAIVLSGPDAGKSFRLAEGRNTIGRSKDCKIQLSDETVSRQHAHVLYSDGKLSVADLGSKSGTRVGTRVLSGTELINGDTITMGQSKFTLMGAAA